MFVCFYGSDKATHREHFIVFISRLNLNFMRLRWILWEVGTNTIDKLLVLNSDRAQVLQTKCPSAFGEKKTLHIYFI